MSLGRALARLAGPLMAAALLVLLLPLAAPLQPARAEGCYVSGAFGLNFGTVSAKGGSASSALSFTCLPDYSGAQQTLYYQLCLHIGAGDQSAGQPTRRMTNYKGAYMNYELFADAAHSQPIGAPGSTPVYQLLNAVPPGAPLNTQATIYGLVYAGQLLPAGSGYQEHALHGQLRYRYASQGWPTSADCHSGGSGGGVVDFETSGVLASYDSGCQISATDLDFGSVRAPQSALYGRASIRVECPVGTAWKLGLGQGLHFDGQHRRMAGAGSHLNYLLHRDESRSLAWGNEEGSMASGLTDGAGNAVSLTVYGEVPAQPEARAGRYSDTVVATLYY